jgi:hypothetical protein
MVSPGVMVMISVMELVHMGLMMLTSQGPKIRGVGGHNSSKSRPAFWECPLLGFQMNTKH